MPDELTVWPKFTAGLSDNVRPVWVPRHGDRDLNRAASRLTGLASQRDSAGDDTLRQGRPLLALAWR